MVVSSTVSACGVDKPLKSMNYVSRQETREESREVPPSHTQYPHSLFPYSLWERDHQIQRDTALCETNWYSKH